MPFPFAQVNDVPEEPLRSGIFRCDALPRSQSQEIMLSQSLGAYPSTNLLHRHLSDSGSKISYAGYLLKRSNHPVSTGPSIPDQSPRPTQQRIVKLGTGNSYSSEEEYMDWEDDFPALPLDAKASDNSLPLFRKPPSLVERNTPNPFQIVDDHNHSDSLQLRGDESQDQHAKEDEQQNPLDKFLKLALDFLGSSHTPPQSTAQTQLLPNTEFSHQIPNATTTGARKSSPIKMPPNSSFDKLSFASDHKPTSFLSSRDNSSSSSTGLKRAQSDGLHEIPSPPNDMLDEKGHIWRAKYCVLQDGVLYFYRNQEDAESSQAHAERDESIPFIGTVQTQNNNQIHDSLARSPVPRKLVLSTMQQHGSSSYDHHSHHLWEKRTPLTMIGAIRSAEAEYGPHSFALLSPPREDDESGDEDDASHNNSNVDDTIDNAEDKLILRARDAKEMGEWLFQFHSSIALFVRSLVLSQQRDSRNNMYHPFSQRAAYVTSPGSPFYNHAPLLSPRVHSTLSHGHGHGRTLSRSRRPDSVSPILNKNIAKSSLTPPRRIKQKSEDALRWFSDKVEKSERTHSSTVLVTSSAQASQSRPSSLSLQNFGSSPSRAEPELDLVAAATAAAAEVSRPAITHPQPSTGVSHELSAPPKPDTEWPVPLHKPTAADTQQPQTIVQPSEEKKLFRKYIPPSRRNGVAPKSFPPPEDKPQSGAIPVVSASAILPLKLGGCADPRVVYGSIMDVAFIKREASVLKREKRADPYGYRHKASGSMTWDIGAVSECGIRSSNEDAYLLAGNLLDVLDENGKKSRLNNYAREHSPGLFCVFDGHLGDQAARFAAERLTRFLDAEASDDEAAGNEEDAPSFVERILRRALEKLDDEFCKFCVEGERKWESGSTALVAVLVDNHLVVGNLGDARAVASRSVYSEDAAKALQMEGWVQIPESDLGNGNLNCLWKEMSKAHSPSREDERRRIEWCNGWITVGQEIPIVQIHRLNLQDEYVFSILQRCFADRYERSPRASAPQRVIEISRVCGELAVSRSLGDRDFKAAFNRPCSDEGHWESSLGLLFPDDHNRCFQGDLILNTPEFQKLRVGESGSCEEFFLFACDGLWDVMDSDDAVRVTRDLLFEKKLSAKEAAARLAEVAVHLGSSDNITVIIVAFFPS